MKYDLPDVARLVTRLAGQGITIRRAMAYEKQVVVDWVGSSYGKGWASECDVAFGNHPVYGRNMSIKMETFNSRATVGAYYAAAHGVAFFAFCWYWHDNGQAINKTAIRGDPKHISWNEWTEGSYLLPDLRWGYGYLRAARNVFGNV